MARGAGIRLPKIKTHKSLFSNKVKLETIELIDEIVEELDVSKWVVIDALLCKSLGVEPTYPINLKKWCGKL